MTEKQEDVFCWLLALLANSPLIVAIVVVVWKGILE